MNNCKYLSDESVEAVAQYCPNISIFTFSGCPKMTCKYAALIANLSRA